MVYFTAVVTGLRFSSAGFTVGSARLINKGLLPSHNSGAQLAGVRLLRQIGVASWHNAEFAYHNRRGKEARVVVPVY